MYARDLMVKIAEAFNNNGFGVNTTSGVGFEMMHPNCPCILIHMQIMDNERFRASMYDIRLNAYINNVVVSSKYYPTLKEAVNAIHEYYKKATRQYAIVGKILTGRSITHYVLQDMYMNTSGPIEVSKVKGFVRQNKVQGATLQMFQGKEIIRLRFPNIPDMRM